MSTVFLIAALYAAITVGGAVLTQISGNQRREFNEGLLAWVFLPIMLIGAVCVLLTEGVGECKHYVHDFIPTFLNRA